MNMHQPLVQAKSHGLISHRPIVHFDGLSAIEGTWRDICREKSSSSFFISFDYIALWYKSFAEPDRVRVYPVFEGERIIGFLPLVLEKNGPVRVLSSLTNPHCRHPGVLVAQGCEDAFSRNFIEALLSDKHGWDVLLYRSGYSFQKDAQTGVANADAYRLETEIKPTYTALLPESIEDYYRHFSAKTRKEANAKKRKLAADPTHRFRHYTGDDALGSWPVFLSIEDSGWKGEGGSSLAKLPPNYRSYYESLIRMLYEDERLHMYFLEINGQAVAGAFCYRDEDVFHCCKTGYNEEHSSLSPSINLILFIIEDIILHHPDVKRFHMFPVDYGYKHRYADEETFYTLMTLYNTSVRGTLMYGRSLLKQRLKLIPGMPHAVRFLRNNVRKQRS
jgi:CelD/BcsL family acetyltransferase involved in cellulose biosynthesis